MSNLNIQNIDGLTSLHIMAKYNMTDEYINVLKDKDLNFFILDKSENTPMKYMKDISFINLLNKITNSTIKNKLDDSINLTNTCNQNNLINLEECRTKIKTEIIKNANKEIFSSVILPDVNKKTVTLFNSDIVHNVIYLIQLLKKYDNIFVPYQDFFADKYMDSLIKMEPNTYVTQYGTILNDLLTVYTKDFFELVPHIIIWHNENIYHYDNDLKYYIKKIIKHKNIRFILLKLTLIPYLNVTHANILLYDIKLNKIERFEPYGYTIMFDKLDMYLDKLFKRVINNDVMYVRPSDYMTYTKFQLISNETDHDNKMLSDPYGYCLAWIYWFVELRLQNPDTEIKELVSSALNKMLIDTETDKNTYVDNDNNKNNILNYIRQYANKLDENKNDFLREIGIKEDDIYKISYSGKRGNIIFENIIKTFNNLVKLRLKL